MKRLISIVLIISVPVIVFLVGPKPQKVVFDSNLPQLAVDITTVENYVDRMEKKVNLKLDNEARILWNNDSLKSKTEYCVLYLHGFSATWYEGYPVNVNLAKHLGANAFFARLASHGIETDDPLIDMKPDTLYETAKEALVIAKTLGEKVIVVGTSTGGTLALMLAADFPDMVNSLILLSPNIAINNPSAFLLTWPWGLQIARQIGGTGNYRVLNASLPSQYQYWYQKYRWEATIYLQQLVEKAMIEDVFAKVTQPVFLGYFYKDEENQDTIVRVDAMLKMFEELGTPADLKYKVAFPDAETHMIGNGELSKCIEKVENEIIGFTDNLVLPKR